LQASSVIDGDLISVLNFGPRFLFTDQFGTAAI